MSTKKQIRELKERIGTHEFYQRELGVQIPVKARGWITKGLCPFHADTRSGSFKIHGPSGAFVCHSCGARGGDVISFLQLRHGLTFLQAVERLERAGRNPR